ncbi:hypothetical protein H8959_016419 [Pygathrix nigripes]
MPRTAVFVKTHLCPQDKLHVVVSECLAQELPCGASVVPSCSPVAVAPFLRLLTRFLQVLMDQELTF